MNTFQDFSIFAFGAFSFLLLLINAMFLQLFFLVRSSSFEDFSRAYTRLFHEINNVWTILGSAAISIGGGFLNTQPNGQESLVHIGVMSIVFIVFVFLNWQNFSKITK